jgi:hypothetical protein
MADCRDGYMKADSDFLAACLVGLIKRKFTGAICVDAGFGYKKIYINDGDIVFAKSNLIDDRLGEVIYRAGLIQIDQMTESAVQVTRDKKFGKVLLNNRIFTSYDLWNALKLQVSEIVQSVFLSEEVYFQIRSGDFNTHTYIVFSEGSDALVERYSSFGRMFRFFRKRLNTGGKIQILDKDPFWKEPSSGTFDGDMLQIVRNGNTIKDIVAQSKLQEPNTILALFRLVNKRLLSVELDSAPALDYGGNLSKVKAKLDAYKILLKIALRSFSDNKTAFPGHDLIQFVNATNAADGPFVQIHSDGEITKESIQNIYFECIESAKQIDKLTYHLESLIQFLLQLCFDYLPMEKAKGVKGQFDELIG